MDANSLPLPLDGVRVCDFSWIIAGPQATRIMADLGADVVKVENESHLDSIRLGLQVNPERPTYNGSGFHSDFNRNKRGIQANLNHPDGRAAVEKLIQNSDIVIENFSAGAFARMGFSWERLQELNPDIIYVSCSGYGHVGRDASYVTWGPTAQAVSGNTYMSGLPDMPPAGWGYSYLDHTAGFYGAIAMLMALWHRKQTGEAQFVDMSQIETGMVLTGVPVLDYQVNGREYVRVGNRSKWPAIAPHGVFRCAADERAPTSQPEHNDDRWIAITVDGEDQWESLCSVLEAPELLRDQRFIDNDLRVRYEEELESLIGEYTRARDCFELMYALQEQGVPAGVCQRTDDKMVRDDQLAEREFYREAPHAEIGVHKYEGYPVSFSGARWRMDRGAPLLGEDTMAVLTDLLGYTHEEVAQMMSELAVS